MKQILLLSFLILSSCTTSNHTPKQIRTLNSDPAGLSVPYAEILKSTREIMKPTGVIVEDRLIRKISETEVIEWIQKKTNQQSLSRLQLAQEIMNESSRKQFDPTKHLRLVPPNGQPGYSELEIFVNHPYYKNNQIQTPANLVEVWNQFLKKAEKEIILNVFDFDLEIIATTLIAKARQGVSVTVGIDKSTIHERPEVALVYKRLLEGQVKVVSVNSTSLNHQKMAAIDWSDIQKSQVLFSSGNLTQSCLGPEGDLKQILARLRPRKSIPNANHVITMKSWLLAQLIHHELTKTLDPQFLYRGSQYPLQGSYQITGPGVNPETFEAYPDNSLIISFSPGGSFRNINKNLISHFIKKSPGPFRMIQFAFSAEEVSSAFIEKAQEQKDNFDFLSVGDTPFAMQDWSQFLRMTGVKRTKIEKQVYFNQVSDPPFKNLMSPDAYRKFRSQIRIAPPEYTQGSVRVQGQSYKVSAKIHHKILSTGPYAILGTSFNFSKNAQINNEQILVFKDPMLSSVVEGMTLWLAKRSQRSVFEESVRRQSRNDGTTLSESLTDEGGI